MECMNHKCNNELTGRQKQVCSDKCRMAVKRTNTLPKANKPERIHLTKPEHKPNQSNPNKPERIAADFERQCLNATAVKANPNNYGQPDCQCRHCQANRANGNKHIINHGDWKPIGVLGERELNRASLPGDVDYKGQRSSIA